MVYRKKVGGNNSGWNECISMNLSGPRTVRKTSLIVGK